MSNKSKAKGTRGETRVVKFLTARGIAAKRRALSGSADQGDIEVTSKGKTITLEVKTGKMTSNPSRSQIAEWLRQTKVETENARCDAGYLVIVRYGRHIKDAEVYRLGYGEWQEMIYLDQFAELLR